MRHRITVKKLSKTPAHRKAMIRNMLVALFRHEQIKTTLAKSKVLQRYAEKLITRAKVDSVHNRRMAAKWIQDKQILAKLFTDIGPLFKLRQGGYTRIIKIGQRYGDASEMVYISFVEKTVDKDVDTVLPKNKKKLSKALSDTTKEDAVSDDSNKPATMPVPVSNTE